MTGLLHVPAIAPPMTPEEATLFTAASSPGCLNVVATIAGTLHWTNAEQAGRDCPAAIGFRQRHLRSPKARLSGHPYISTVWSPVPTNAAARRRPSYEHSPRQRGSQTKRSRWRQNRTSAPPSLQAGATAFQAPV